ncbi:MAG TPA: helix-turn-helix domain-containing protein [Patescibacteria group bacterium]
MSMLHLRLKQLRRERNMSQEDLARKLGVSRQALIAIEQGASLPSLRVIMALIDALEVTFNDLFGPAWSPFRSSDSDTESESSQLSLYRYQERGKTLPVTMHEDSATFHIYAELAGVQEEDLTVDLSTQHVLIVAIKRSCPPPSNDLLMHIEEINFGPLLRVIAMPSPIAADQARAEFKSGLLHLTLPKLQPEVSRRITFKKETIRPDKIHPKEEYGSE